ncbi:unnamed protein product [Prunus armeniaca]|uniref:Uncharacterized protein n=1 Tax=Prunus armeniaca TaxID=36596 RepID=A0A6J5X663_PRUAR|nr:unnamed protein product [Prunus armeniaca]
MKIVEEALDVSEESLHIIVDAKNLFEATKIGSVKLMEAKGNIESHHQPLTPSAVVGNIEEMQDFQAYL